MLKSSGLLNRIQVHSPCTANWYEMVGTERIRFCDECKLNVYNISAMTTKEAFGLVNQAKGRVCVKFDRDEGVLITADSLFRQVKRRLVRFSSLVLISLLGFTTSVVAVAASRLEDNTQGQKVTGKRLSKGRWSRRLKRHKRFLSTIGAITPLYADAPPDLLLQPLMDSSSIKNLKLPELKDLAPPPPKQD